MERIQSIDFIKGVAITSVVMGHTCVFPQISPFFSLWHMAAFFIIGGWFFNAKYWENSKNVGSFCQKKIKRIWWPFVLWCSLFIIFHNFLYAINVFSSNTAMAWKWLSADYYRMWSCREVIKKLLPVFVLKGNLCQLGPLWFLNTMFFASIFYCLLGYFLTLLKFNKIFWLSLISLLSLFVARYYYPRHLSIIMHYVGGKHVLMAFPLIHLGYLLRYFGVDYSKIKCHHSRIIGGIICFLILLALMLRVRIIYSRCEYPRIGYLLLSALAGFYFAMALSYVPVISSIFALVGKYSMSILIFHFLAYDIIDALRVMIKGLPWEYVSSFPILAADWRWGICYVFVAVAVPIMLNHTYLYLAKVLCRFYHGLEIFGKHQSEPLKEGEETYGELISSDIQLQQNDVIDNKCM